ncbi:response regulator transcription factor [Paraflavitalea speifideaquila]|uniref:response regulator transcription factor n=1 Tax=Paraflavitalea speifideaquila TaxID=3076558 RepID=UPI0028EF78B5|nr:response regulator transcription factor [Paraflavitalea speifideiaquila]
MTAKRLSILFVEDELNLAEIVKESLESRGFEVVHHPTATAALEAYYAYRPDILILDVMLPDADGFSLARQIRATDMDTPVIFLTSKSLPQDVVTGFESGGNDYLKKPFSMEELVVRIKALTSKSRTLFAEMASPDAPVAIGAAYSFHYQQATLRHQQATVALTAREAELIKLLLLNKNQVIDRKSILLHIWGNDDFYGP